MSSRPHSTTFFSWVTLKVSRRLKFKIWGLSDRIIKSYETKIFKLWQPLAASNGLRGQSNCSELHKQYMQSHSGRIPSILEWFLPSWNKSFQDGRNPSGFVPEFGYDSHPQNSSSIFVNVIWKIFFPISFYCRDILHLPWSDSLVWKESFQTGRNPSRLEWILPV